MALALYPHFFHMLSSKDYSEKALILPCDNTLMSSRQGVSVSEPISAPKKLRFENIIQHHLLHTRHSSKRQGNNVPKRDLASLNGAHWSGRASSLCMRKALLCPAPPLLITKTVKPIGAPALTQDPQSPSLEGPPAGCLDSESHPYKKQILHKS